MTIKNKASIVILIIMIALITTAGVYWKIAKDEVFYLCGNFSAGVTQSSVIRQLDTANLSAYQHHPQESGSTIVFSSKLFFVSHQCTIELDTNDEVVMATFS